jgi:signal transduction histidine kinase
MKISQAKKKYKIYWRKMYKHLRGVTASVTDEKLDIPERDLEYAFDMVTKGKSNIAWD